MLSWGDEILRKLRRVLLQTVCIHAPASFRPMMSVTMPICLITGGSSLGGS